MGRMSRRQPAGVRFETWIDRQIRQAADRGDFDHLPGRGHPQAGVERPYEEMWWVKQKLREEGISYLPPALALRREIHDLLEGAGRARSEVELRERVEAMNERIKDAIRTPQREMPIDVVPLDVERVVREWRERG